MARSLKMTPFARFFFVMIILAPLAYIGASYYRGEDGLQNIKNLFGGNKTQTTQTRQKSSDIETLRQEVNELRLRVEALERLHDKSDNKGKSPW
ncbi:MAG TPA: hypothetical protein PKE06_26125 [Flavilitoribacter sp.]|nr:hypothetical protein [Flavilitoribacter sp.]